MHMSSVVGASKANFPHTRHISDNNQPTTMLLLKKKRGRNASKKPFGSLSCLLLVLALTAVCLFYSQHGLLAASSSSSSSSVGTARYLDERTLNQHQQMSLKLASVRVGDSTNEETATNKNNKLTSSALATKVTADLSFRDALVDCSTLKQTFAHVPDPNHNNHQNNHNNNMKEDDSPKFVAHTHKTPRPYYVSLHDPEYDKTRALLLDKGRYYETTLQDRWSEILLQAPPSVRVLDVGGNIGYYTLFSASLGNFIIDTFEPNPINLFRVCESLRLNKWVVNEFEASSATTTEESLTLPSSSSSSLVADHPMINLWRMGASETKGHAQFDPYPQTNNPGAGKILASNVQEKTTPKGRLIDINTITLDDFAAERGWLDGDTTSNSPQRIEILKVDVEKHEAEVFLGASRLLATKQIRHIFAEFSINQRNQQDATKKKAALQGLFDAGYTLCCMGGFKGPTTPVSFGPNEIDAVMDRIAEKREATNLWWQAELPCWKP